MASEDTVTEAIDKDWPNAPECPFDDEVLERRWTQGVASHLWCPWCECVFDPSAWIRPT